MPLDPNYLGTTLAWPIRFGVLGYDQAPDAAKQGRINSGTASSYVAAVMKQTWTAPATIVTNGFSVAHVGQVAAGTINMTLGGSLVTAGVGVNDFARNVVITVTHASAVVALSGVISGTDIYGRLTTETWSVTAGTTSKTYTGTKAFKKVTSITEVNAADASADTIIAGNGKVLGLAWRTNTIKPIAELESGVTPTAGVLVAGVGGSATASYMGTYTPNSTLNATLNFTIWFLSDDPTDLPNNPDSP